MFIIIDYISIYIIYVIIYLYIIYYIFIVMGHGSSKSCSC